MAEEKSSRSEAWKDKFKDAYIDTVRQIDKLNKKATLARQGMEEANKGGDLTTIDPTTKEMVGYEMLVRFAMERHMIADIGFSQVSSILDRKKDGKNIPCPDCNGTGGADHKCKSCGGIGKVIDHDFALAFKTLSGIGDLNRSIWELSQAVKKGNAGASGMPTDTDDPDQVMDFAFSQLYQAGLKGKEAEEALKQMAKTMKFSDEDAKALFVQYEMYVKKRESGEGASTATQKVEKVEVVHDGKEEKTAG